MIVKHFECTAIHNKALYKCIIHSFIHAKRKLEADNSNQHRFIYTRSLKCHVVVMLGDRIDVAEAPISNLKAYLLPLPDQKNEIKRADWTQFIVKNACVCSTHLLSDKVT